MTSLPEQDVLVVLAEVSVAVAGFSGIMAVVGGPKDALAREKTKALVTGAVMVLVFSLLPLVVGLSGTSTDDNWRFCAGLFLGTISAYYLVNRDGLGLLLESNILKVCVAGDVAMVVALLASIVGLPIAGQSFVFIGSLLWVLSQVLIFFVESVAALWRNA